MVFLEWKMEWGRQGRAGAIRRGVLPHRRPDALGGRRQSAMGLARELARSAGSEMEPVRELLSGRFVLRLGWVERVRATYAARSRRSGEFPIQDDERVSASNEDCARQTNRDRRVRVRASSSESGRERMGQECARGFIFRTLAGRHWVLLVERIVGERRRAE